MKTSTSAAIILCTLIIAAVVLVCTGHGEVVEGVVAAAIMIVFLLFV